MLTFYEVSDMPTPLRWQIPLVRVRDIIERREFYLVRMRKLGFATIAVDSFESDEDRASFIRIVAHAIEARQAEVEAL